MFYKLWKSKNLLEIISSKLPYKLLIEISFIHSVLSLKFTLEFSFFKSSSLLRFPWKFKTFTSWFFSISKIFQNFVFMSCNVLFFMKNLFNETKMLPTLLLGSFNYNMPLLLVCMCHFSGVYILFPFLDRNTNILFGSW